MATANESAIPNELDPITLKTLGAFRRRRGLLLVLRTVAVSVLVFVSLAMLLATIDYLFFLDDRLRWALSLGIYVATAVTAWAIGIGPLRSRDSLSIARRVETAAPELREDLVSAVELADPDASNGSPHFRRILQNRVAKRIARVKVSRLLPLGLVTRWLFSGGAIVALCVALMFIPAAQFGRRFARAALPGVAIERASRTKVTILKPDPPSGYVAERDAVGVIVRVNGAADDVVLHWRSADGAYGESIMTPRVNASQFLPGDDANTDDAETTSVSGDLFAANLSVGSVPLEYRVTAGDAITLWHKLTPLPRPRATLFQKTYQFPEYSKLPDRIESEEHGDLKALRGTTAQVTVTFDQPVESALLRFGVRGPVVDMEPVDESDTKFTTNVSIKTAGQYQVDATSLRSGLNNPFSPTNSITPVLDTPPSVRWDSDIPTTQLVSSLDVLELAGSAADDLPLDRVIQEFKVNDGRFQAINVPMTGPDKKLDLAWSWDLMHRLGEGRPTKKLTDGDLIQTRLVAIDRMGTRTESTTIDLLVAGDAFNADRHDFLEPLSDRVEKIIGWTTQSQLIAESLEETIKSSQFERLAGLQASWKPLQAEAVELIKAQVRTLNTTEHLSNANLTELEGRAIVDIESRLTGLMELAGWLADHSEQGWEKQAAEQRKRLAYRAKSAGHQAERLQDFVRGRMSMAVTAAIYSDAIALKASVERIVAANVGDRISRYLNLLAGRLVEIDRVFAEYEDLLSPTTVHHLSGESWSNWSSRWASQFETIAEQEAAPDQILAVLRSLEDQLRHKPQQAIDSRIHDTVIRCAKDLPVEIGYLSDRVRELNEAGVARDRSKRAMEQNNKANEAKRLGQDLRWYEAEWQERLRRLTIRAAGQEKLNRAKPKVDLAYAADQKLFLRAIRNVTEQGYQGYGDESAGDVFREIQRAIRVLQASNDFVRTRDNLAAIRDGERRDDASPLRKIYHPTWFGTKNGTLELPVRTLKDFKADYETIVKLLDNLKYNDDHRQASTRIDRRRWSMDPMVSAINPIDRLIAGIDTGQERIADMKQHARDVLNKYVLTVSEQAREAAEKAREAEKETDERKDDTDQTAQELKETQEEATDKATETIQALIDQANTAELTDAEQREMARDADAAAELIADAVQDTKEELKKADAAASDQERQEALESAEQALDQLADRLEQTADHFEKLENGEDVTESRQELRQAEQDLAASNLQERYERAEKMAEAANQDPRELLRQLEEELARNEPMQEALSDISADLVEDAQRNLEQASEDEQNINRRLESEDTAFAEQKRQKRMMLDEFAQRARSLRDQTLNTASQAASWANEPQTRDKIEAARKQLEEAVKAAESVSHDHSSLNEIQQATEKMQEILEQTAETSKQVAEFMEEKSGDDLHQDERNRKRSADKLEDMLNRLKNDEVRALDQQRKTWNQQEKRAATRARNADNQRKRAENDRKRAEDRAKKDPDNQSHQREVAKHAQREQEAQRTEQESRQTRELAKQRQQLANKRSDAINRQKTQPLDKNNPAAELAERVASNARERMEQLAEELAELRGDSAIEADLEAAEDTANNLAREQQQVEEDVDGASADVARAARHEERLGQEALAEQLAQAAEQTEQTAGQAAENATEQLGQAAEEQNAAQASQALEDSMEQSASAAERLGDILQQGQTSDQAQQANAAAANPTSADPTQSPSPSPPSNSSSQPPSPGQLSSSPPPDAERARQMAQTLDELDRALAEQSAQQSGEPQPGEPGENGQPSEGQPGQPQAGEPGGEPGENGENGQNAMEASPTLAQMLEAAMQQAARERMQSLQQGEAQSSASENSNAPSTESGDGEPPDGPESVDLLTDITDGDWGSLRRQGVDNAAQGRGAQIPPGYAKEVQAYFKAISKRAAEREQ